MSRVVRVGVVYRGRLRTLLYAREKFYSRNSFVKRYGKPGEVHDVPNAHRTICTMGECPYRKIRLACAAATGKNNIVGREVVSLAMLSGIWTCIEAARKGVAQKPRTEWSAETE